MSASRSESKATQITTQTTTQIDNRVGASDGSVIAQHGSVVNIRQIDPATVAAALGLSEEVVVQMAELASTLTDSTVSEMSAVSQRSMETVLEALQTVANNTERTTAEMSIAFDRFGQDLSNIKAIEVTGGASDSNRIIAFGIGGVVLLGAILLWRNN